MKEGACSDETGQDACVDKVTFGVTLNWSAYRFPKSNVTAYLITLVG